MHVVKIDRAFISELDAGEKPRTLVKSMITLIHELGYRVVGEGVECAEVAEILRELKCDEVQGYFFGRPMEIADFNRWLRSSLPESLLIAS